MRNNAENIPRPSHEGPRLRSGSLDWRKSGFTPTTTNRRAPKAAAFTRGACHHRGDGEEPHLEHPESARLARSHSGRALRPRGGTPRHHPIVVAEVRRTLDRMPP